MNDMKREDGVALILALIILLILSILGITISFKSNTDFQMMSNYKQGQEAFLAAERCVEEARRQFEGTGIETLFFQLQGGISSSIELTLPYGAKCRTGDRNFNRANASVPPPPLVVAPIQKASGRPRKHTQLLSGGGGLVIPSYFLITGKDSGDKDKDDTDPNMNTGTEIYVGFENFIAGGASNVY